ncbi:DNA packaging protein FI, partial [Enterobacter hormaechei]
ADSDRRKELILRGELVRVPETILALLIAAGLVAEC